MSNLDLVLIFSNNFKKAVEKKVAVVPGNAFLTDENAETQYIRLNFSTPTDEGIINGVKALGEVAREYRR